MATEAPVISFIVPAHNEQELIEPCLRSIRDAADALSEPYEIVVVNDASTDATRSRALACGARVVDVALRRISAVRNAGAAAAHGRYLVFVDADTQVTRAVVRAAAAALDAGDVGGGCRVAFEGRIPFWARLFLPVFSRLYRWFGGAAGCFVYCTRSAYEQVGGFDESLYASEEVSLSWALARVGRFRVLREHVVTSGRKLRTHTAGELLGALLRLGWGGRAAVRDGRRPELGIWYAPRRTDQG